MCKGTVINMFKFLKLLMQPKLIKDFEPRPYEPYSWEEGALGHMYISKKNRKILYRVFKTDGDLYQVEILNGVPKMVGIFMDLDSAKTWAEKNWVDINTWIS